MTGTDIIVVLHHVSGGYAGVVQVGMCQQGEDGIRGSPYLCVLQGLQVGVIEDRYRLVLQDGVNHPALAIDASLLLFSRRRRFYSPVGAHSDTVFVLPGPGGRTKGVSAMRAYL